MKRLSVIGAALGALLAAGCLTDSQSLAGIEGTGSPATVSGSVTAYGSIYVNGLHIDIDTADIYIDGEPAGTDDITLGMVVDVDLAQLEGANALAGEVRYTRDLRGPVDALISGSDVRRELRLLGQTVVVYDDIQLDGVSFASLEPGVHLEVSGLIDAQGHWRATRVAAADPGPLTARGAIIDWNAGTQRFQLGRQQVDASEAEITGELADDRIVALRGGERRGEFWYPDRIKVLERSEPREGAQLIKEGVIERYVSREEFDLQGVTVDATNAEGFDGAAELGVGDRVMVRGERRDGTLVATRLEVLLPGVNRIRASIDDIDPETGDIVLLGGGYQATDLTAFENPAGRGRAQMNLHSLRVGDWIELYTYYQGEARVVTRIRRQTGNTDSVALSGPVTDINQENRLLTVMDVTVAVQGASGEALFDELVLGDPVTVSGVATGSHVTATTLERRDVPADVRTCPPPLAEVCAPASTAQFNLPAEGAMHFRF